MEQYTLPDGRQPIRFGKGRSAYYEKSHGEGEVCYLFSMIKHIQKNRQPLSPEVRSRIAKDRAAKLKAKDPNFYKDIGTIGGRNGRKDS